MLFDFSEFQFDEGDKRSKDVSFLRLGFDRITLFNTCGLFKSTMEFFNVPAVFKMSNEVIVIGQR